MPGYCTVPFCTSTKGKVPGVSFHEFPSDSLRRQEWLAAISKQGKENETVFLPTARTVVCSKHFRSGDFRNDLKIRKLTPTACPSIFPYYPFYKAQPPIDAPVDVPRDVAIEPPNKKIRVLQSVENTIRKDTSANSFDNLLQETDALEREFCVRSIEVDPKPHQINAATQTTENQAAKCNELLRLVSNLKKVISRRNASLEILQDQVNSNLKTNRNPHNIAFQKLLKEASEKDNVSAQFLVEQVLNYSKKKPKYCENTLRQCIAWRARSTKGYEHARKNSILKLPSRKTLNSYMGNSPAEVGITTLVKQRLLVEIENLQPEERFGSIIIDEMSIQEKLIYDKDQDRCFGNVDMGERFHEKDNRLANHLLCFILEGLSTRFTIPVAYFFTRCLKGTELHKLTLDVLSLVESCGFQVIRIVTDNHRTNVAMFRLFGKGTLKVQVQHPLETSRFLFLSFDPNHIIKNLWVQFLSREMASNNSTISAKYAMKLADIQKNMIFKPARFLSRIHINPTNYEKMRVFPAVQLFSPSVTAAIECLRDNPLCHPEAPFFKDSSESIRLMKAYYKWFRLHNISNRTYFITSRDETCMHFFSINDERLDWLRSDFITYLEDIKSDSESLKSDFLTNETFEAAIHTSKATANCIHYLLSNGFAFVYTRSFSSDPVECFYSALRQMCGGNDVVDTRAAIFAIEGILKAGICLAVKGKTIPQIQPQELQTCSEDYTASTLNILEQIRTFTSNTIVPQLATMQNFSLTMIGGYLVRVIEEHIPCQECKSLLSTAASIGPLFSLVRNQDRGGLFYPKPAFVIVLGMLELFCKQAVPKMNLKNSGVLKRLELLVRPKMEECEVFKCVNFGSEENHNQKLCSLIFLKFVRPLLTNYSNWQTAKVKKTLIQHKPLSRKVLRF